MPVRSRTTGAGASKAAAAGATKSANGALPEYTWQQVAEHCTLDDCWMSVRGKVYDVTAWVPKHPGGTDVLHLNAGKDATQVFESYHPLSVAKVLNKYEVGTLSTTEYPTFPPMSDFYVDLKGRIEQYFKDHKHSPRYAPRVLILTLFFVTIMYGAHYASIMLLYTAGATTSALLGALALQTVVGFMGARISFMPVHEGSHCSTFSSPWLWRILGATHDFANGASFYIWLHQHFLGHHPFTSVDGFDPDTETNDPDMRRIKWTQPFSGVYKYQHIYVPVLYGLLGLKFRINDMSIMFFLKRNGVIRLNEAGAWHMTMFVAGKLFWLFARILVPGYYIGFGTAFALSFYADLISSYILALVFQVNHVVEECEWPQVDAASNTIDMDWAELQLRTTLDYSHNQWLTAHLVGGLNYQVVHHLFPYISQVHYASLAPIIVKACEEYNLPYHVRPTYWDALKDHLRYLKTLGNQKHKQATAQ